MTGLILRECIGVCKRLMTRALLGRKSRGNGDFLRSCGAAELRSCGAAELRSCEPERELRRRDQCAVRMQLSTASVYIVLMICQVKCDARIDPNDARECRAGSCRLPTHRLRRSSTRLHPRERMNVPGVAYHAQSDARSSLAIRDFLTELFGQPRFAGQAHVRPTP